MPAVYAADATRNMFAPSYILENGIEKSRRSYLLVYLPEKDERRQVSVVSECQKPYQEEGVYGTCKHHISILPSGKTFTVDTGEDVVMIATAWDTPLVLGTVDYGCCAAPLTITFYREDGQRLGALKKTPGALHSMYGNAITRLWNLGNSTGRRDKAQFLVIQDDQKDDLFYALKKDMHGKFIKLPIRYRNSNEAKCDDWLLGEFVKYGDRGDTTLALEGFFCANNTKEGYEKKLYSCQEQDKAIECTERR
jgi:hypothetical protein